MQRDNRGEITSVDVFHEGDPEYDERTRRREREQNRQSYYGVGTIEQTETVVTEGHK